MKLSWNALSGSLCWALCAALPLGLSSPAQAPARVPLGGGAERNAPIVLQAFSELARPNAASIATVVVDGAAVALATVVAAEGLLVSKSSEIGAAAMGRFADGRTLPLRVLARDPNRDLALLYVDAQGLRPVEWSDEAAQLGQLVTAPGADGRPLSVGVVGVESKRIASRHGRLGVVLAFEPAGAVVALVSPGSPAELVGLRPGDRIVTVAGLPVANRAEVAERIRAHGAGEVVRIGLRRGDDELELEPMLAALGNSGGRRSRLEGDQSALREGFPSALQHDCVLAPEQCGGPLVGLDGRAVGLNIARAGRVASYAIPAADARLAIRELRARAGW